MTILSGTVSIEDGAKAKEEYAPARKVRVDLTFAVPEGSDGQPFLDTTARMADAKVRELLGRPAAAGAPVLQVAIATVGTPVAGKAATETAAAKKARLAAEKVAVEPGKTKADLAKEAGLPTTDTVHKGATEGLVEDEATPTAEDELGDLLGDAAPVPISDQELGRMAQDKMAKLKADQGEKFSPVAIRELINTFSGGKRIADIPSVKRHEFKAALEALK